MDPIGPWYVSYNRLTSTPGITSTFQATAPASTSTEPISNHLTSSAVVTQTVPSTTTSQLLLQAAHTTATLADQSTSFNPGGFLSSPTAVGYDVFTPSSFTLFHHSNSKQPAHYMTQNPQPVVQTQVVATSKPSSPAESDIPVLRSSYTSPQQNDTYFDHQTAATSPTATNWNLSHSTSSQITSPFGILPHESITVSSPPGPAATTKSASSVSYDNPFVTHYNSNGTVSGTDAKTNSWSDSDPTKKNRAQSPISNSNNSIKCIVTESSISGAHSFFQGSSAFDSDGLTTSYSPEDQSTATSPAVQSSLHHQSCIVSTPNITPSNRISQLPSRSPVPTTIYMNTATPDKTSQGNHEHTGPDAGHDSSQSSPISFSIMDSRNLNYSTNNNTNKQQSSNGTLQFHVLTQQPQTPQQPSSCRLYSSNTEPEYHHPIPRSKSSASTDSAYSSNTSQNGPDCAVVVPRRPSPLQAHSQASPLGHVPSPATYPMYNSPMASMSSPSPLQQQHGEAASTPYKTGNLQQQMTPPSPLDVTVTRSPSQQGQAVAYSSVITRALGANENNKTSYNADVSTRATYERSQDFSQAKQMCWDNDSRHQSNDPQKFATSNYLASSGTEATVLVGQQIQTIVNVPDRQPCLESTINLQDLSSCRGDPLNVVKNLPSVHSSGSSESDELKDDEERLCQQAAGVCVKRKSLDKIGGEMTSIAPVQDFLNRIPPPAHHNIVVNQPQQNGYVELERWNLTTIPHAKVVTATPATFIAQQPQQQPAAQIHTANIVGNATVVHQPILVAQHTTPAVSYFPTFHIAPTTGHHVTQMQPQQHPHMVPTHHMSHELHPTMEMNSTDCVMDSCQLDSSCVLDSMRDDKRQVLDAPNIEDDLGHLQRPELATSTRVCPPVVNNLQPILPEPKKTLNNDPNSSGFMTSFLKFLQGEKDSSPPPAVRGRKASWHNRRPYLPTESNVPNGDAWNKSNVGAPTSSEKSNDIPQIDYANDPRYFPLPKERKKQTFDSSDDGFSSDDELPSFASKQERKTTVDGACQVESQPITPAVPPKQLGPDGKPKKGRPIKPGGPTDRKRKAAAAAAAAAAARGLMPSPVIEETRKKELPRRESSRRKAKEKLLDTQQQQQQQQQSSTDPYDVEEEQGDSDSDPAWTPAAKSTGEDEDKRKKRGRSVISKRKKLDDFSDPVVAPKRPGRKKKNLLDPKYAHLKFGCKIDEKLLASVSDEDIDISPFKSGEFVVIKTDLEQEYPPLWRIDGKTLLQKYEPFQANGKTLYRNISTYSGWAPQNRHIYQQVPVKFWQQSKLETIVEFLREEMILEDSEIINKLMKETEKYQDNFEVYIQTLISQALDSNFLTEIFQEQDDYFLLNVKTVDEITEERKQRLLSTTNWQQNVITELSTWPCINVLRDNIADYKGKACAGCTRTKIHARVLLYGQPYNSTTLEGSPPDPQVPQEKDFLFCRICQTKVGLFNKVAHQKYLMFLECARRVADKRVADPHKDTTIILNELLADEAWLNQLFRDVREIWAEVDNIEQQVRRKAGLTAVNTGDNAAAPSTQMMKFPGASNESQGISYNDQMSSNFS